MSSVSQRLRDLPVDARIIIGLTALACAIALGAWIRPNPFQRWGDPTTSAQTNDVTDLPPASISDDTAPTSGGGTETLVKLTSPELFEIPEDPTGLLPASCGRSSRSSRDDALACAPSAMYLDPCFVVTESQAACTTQPDGVFSWVSIEAVIGDLDSPPRLSLDEATQGHPFAIELEDGTVCLWEVVGPERAERTVGEAAYTCGVSNYLLQDADGFFTGDDRGAIAIDYEGETRGRALQVERGNPWWTVLYAPEGDMSYEKTRIAVAYY